MVSILTNEPGNCKNSMVLDTEDAAIAGKLVSIQEWGVKVLYADLKKRRHVASEILSGIIDSSCHHIEPLCT